jgi:hypothetical protein
MITAQEIEGYMLQMNLPFEQVAAQTWMIHDEYDTIENIIVQLNEPVVFFRVKLMDIADGTDREKLFETLLQLNATDMLHGAYGLEGNAVVATDTLQAENLDFNEFQASVDSLSLCISDHFHRVLAPFYKGGQKGAA